MKIIAFPVTNLQTKVLLILIIIQKQTTSVRSQEQKSNMSTKFEQWLTGKKQKGRMTRMEKFKGSESFLLYRVNIRVVDQAVLWKIGKEKWKRWRKTEKVTGIAQPLDVYFNRPYKNLVRNISDKIMQRSVDIQLHDRKEKLKLQSLCLFLFQAPKFSNLIKYSFKASGYIDGEYEFPVPKSYCFPMQMKDCEINESSVNCDNRGFIRCSHCEKFLCFDHFYVIYHRKFCISQ